MTTGSRECSWLGAHAWPRPGHPPSKTLQSLRYAIAYVTDVRGIAMTPDSQDHADVAGSGSHAVANLSASRVPEPQETSGYSDSEYFESITRADVTLEQVIRTKILMEAGSKETRQLAISAYPAIWERYKTSHTNPYRNIISYSFGQAAWGIVLFSDGQIDYEYPILISSKVTVKWDHLVRECTEAIAEAAMVLRGKQKRLICARLYAQLHTLLSATDMVLLPLVGPDPFSYRVKSGGPARLDRMYNPIAEKIKSIRQSVDDLAVQTDRRIAQQQYLIGMIPGLVIVVALIFGAYQLRLPFYSLASVPHTFDLGFVLGGGALGALLSVLGRTTSAQLSKSLQVDTQAGAALIISAGAFRPLVGALLAVSLYLLIGSGLLPIKIPSGPQSLFFISAISLLAGFSERLAQDALVRTSRSIFRSGRTEKPGTDD